MKKIVKSIKIIKKEIIKNSKGDILKYLNKKDDIYQRFGEIYFSEVKKNKTKGWNFHKKNTCILSVPLGSVKFKIFNPKTNKLIQITIGKNNYKLVIIPPGFWFSFKSQKKISLVANFMSSIHSKNEALKKNIINGIKIK
jgi:dTDP-4-dehydrorhamnose 3,5-epimerase